MTPAEFEALKFQLQHTKTLSIEIVSNSMAPVMPTGTLAEIAPVEFEKIQPMDFVVFYSEGIFICHAAWEVGFFKAANGERTLITRGLANPLFDDPVRESMILGRVTSHSVTRAKFFWLALKTRILIRFGRQPKQTFKKGFEEKLKNNVRR